MTADDKKLLRMHSKSQINKVNDGQKLKKKGTLFNRKSVGGDAIKAVQFVPREPDDLPIDDNITMEGTNTLHNSGRATKLDIRHQLQASKERSRSPIAVHNN